MKRRIVQILGVQGYPQFIQEQFQQHYQKLLFVDHQKIHYIYKINLLYVYFKIITNSNCQKIPFEFQNTNRSLIMQQVLDVLLLMTLKNKSIYNSMLFLLIHFHYNFVNQKKLLKTNQQIQLNQRISKIHKNVVLFLEFLYKFNFLFNKNGPRKILSAISKFKYKSKQVYLQIKNQISIQLQKDSLNLQCTYIPPIAILHKPSQRIDFSDVMNLLQNYQNYNTRDFRQSHLDFDQKTFYVTIHDEKKSILKDGDDNAIVIINSQTIITIGIVDQFSKCKKQLLQTLYLFDKLKNDNYKQLF